MSGFTSVKLNNNTTVYATLETNANTQEEYLRLSFDTEDSSLKTPGVAVFVPSVCRRTLIELGEALIALADKASH